MVAFLQLLHRLEHLNDQMLKSEYKSYTTAKKHQSRQSAIRNSTGKGRFEGAGEMRNSSNIGVIYGENQIMFLNFLNNLSLMIFFYNIAKHPKICHFKFICKAWFPYRRKRRGRVPAEDRRCCWDAYDDMETRL